MYRISYFVYRYRKVKTSFGHSDRECIETVLREEMLTDARDDLGASKLFLTRSEQLKSQQEVQEGDTFSVVLPNSICLEEWNETEKHWEDITCEIVPLFL